jgi:hypothetical protein
VVDALTVRIEELDEFGAAVKGADVSLASDDAVGHVLSFVDPTGGDPLSV